ncbi:benzoate 4-monooxygenase cytochrome P450 [Elsinoe ampelina]|uniref:Benzoate 4-monooxygenase cytochrome P450 n=1 Tax=Elsinoe ampelina TaxID=302913 RepID=A0A6A6GIU4_9PEZI|nr:benzoate 4-monooxygenase cytochrome P450 [Elsinoe ampelina]
MAVTAFAIGTGLAAAVVVFVVPLLTSPLNRIPGPFAAKLTDLWRLLVVWKGNAHEVHRKLHKQHGSVVRLGPKCVSINDPDLIKVIYSSKTRWEKSAFYNVHDFVLGKQILSNVFSTRDENWHTAMTKPVHSVFTTTNVLQFEGLMTDIIKYFTQRLEEQFVISGEPCDISLWLHLLAWDIISAVTFSRNLGFLRNGSDIDNLILYGQEALNYQAVIGQMPWLDKLLDKNLYWRNGPPASQAALGFALGTIGEREKDRSEGRRDSKTAGHEVQRDLLDDFLDLRDGSEAVTDQHVLAWVMASVIAGSDTTAIELRAIVYFLCKDPSKIRKLQAELDAVSSDSGIINWKDASKLPYLDAVIRESVRLHPAVALSLERLVPAEGFKLPDGEFLPGGTVVGINPAVIHYNNEVYGSDVEKFVPERWLKKDGEAIEVFQERTQRMRETDMSFGYGKRACIGKNVAQVEIYKIIGTLFQKYDLELVEPEKEWKTKNKWFHWQWDLNCHIKAR